MEAIVQVLSAHDPAAELSALLSSLLFEEALEGKVKTSFAGDAPSGHFLVVTLGADGVGAALTRGLAAWMQHRVPAPRVRLTIDLAPGDLTPAAVHELSALLEPTATDGATQDMAPRPSGGDARERLIARIYTSVFRKPPRGRRGYDEDEVDAYLDALIAALRSGKPMDPITVGRVSFRKPPFGKRGYDEDAVDELLEEIQQQLRTLGS